MWGSTVPWGIIGQGVLSETIGSLIAAGILAGGGWVVRRLRCRRSDKAAVQADVRFPQPLENDSRIDV